MKATAKRPKITIDMLGIVSLNKFNNIIGGHGQHISIWHVGILGIEPGKVFIGVDRNGRWYGEEKVMALLLSENKDINHEFVKNYTFPAVDKTVNVTRPNEFKTRKAFSKWDKENKKSLYRNPKTVKVGDIKYIYIGSIPCYSEGIYLVQENSKFRICDEHEIYNRILKRESN